MKTIHIGLLGFGVVGAGVAKLLKEKKELLESRIGACLNLKTIADLDITTDRGVDLTGTQLTTDAMSVINDPEIDIIVELIGGQTVARDFIVKILENKKHVVTANKALLAVLATNWSALPKRIRLIWRLKHPVGDVCLS